MNRLFKHILPFFVMLLAVSCSGTLDDTVPEGVLRIFADKTEISADGNDEVTFTVMFGSRDVSNEKTLQIIREFDGEQKYMAFGANKFSTVTAGTYKFTAKFYYEGNHISDNEVEIVASPYFSGEEKEYEQRVLGVYFTSTGCSSCPSSTNGLKILQAANPGKISIVAFHSDMANISDPMAIPETGAFNAALGGFEGLPRLFWNMRQGTYLIGPSFTESYAEETAAYKPQCGVSIDTELIPSSYDGMPEGNSGIMCSVSVGITSNLPSVYRYMIFIVEDGIVTDQTGDKDYVHNNVVRAVLTSEKGDKINDNLPLTVGVEAKATKTLVLSPEWNKDNLRVVVAATTSVDGGYTFVANNVAECRLGESISYNYAE